MMMMQQARQLCTARVVQSKLILPVTGGDRKSTKMPVIEEIKTSTKVLLLLLLLLFCPRFISASLLFFSSSSFSVIIRCFRNIPDGDNL